MSGKLFVVLSPGWPAGESERRKLLAKGLPPREKPQKLAAESPPGCLNYIFSLPGGYYKKYSPESVQALKVGYGF